MNFFKKNIFFVIIGCFALCCNKNKSNILKSKKEDHKVDFIMQSRADFDANSITLVEQKNEKKSKSNNTVKDTYKNIIKVGSILDTIFESGISNNSSSLNTSTKDLSSRLLDEKELVQIEKINQYKKNKCSLKCIIITLYAVLTQLSMLLIQRLWGVAAPSYSYFFVAIIPFACLPFFGVSYILERFFQKKKYSSWQVANFDNFKVIAKQSLISAVLLTITYWAIIVSNPYVPGPVQIVFVQTPIIFSVLLSSKFFKRKYSNDAYLGVFFIFLGACLQILLPLIMETDIGDFNLEYYTLFFISMIPLGILSLCFEAFNKPLSEIDNRPVTAELSLLATFFLLGIFILIITPLFLILNQPPKDEFLINIKTAFKCITTGSGGLPNNDCMVARPILWGIIPLVFAQIHAQLLLARHITGALSSVMVFTAPFLGYFIYPFLPNQYQEIPTIHTIVNATLSFVGVAFFANADLRDSKKYIKLKDIKFLKWFFK